MYATAEGTARYIRHFPDFRKAGFFRTVMDLNVSSLGLGTYLGPADDATDAAYTEAILTAVNGGVNFLDTAINYRDQRSERMIGSALKAVQRDEVVVATKAGFLTPGAIPDFLTKDDVAGGMHSLAPAFLSDQIERSRVNLGVDTIDIFYLHNPETQLGFCSRDQFDQRIRQAFARLEALADRKAIRWYGAASWEGFRKGALSLERMVEIAHEVGGAEHRFRFIQLPFNLGMVEAYIEKPESVLAAAGRLGIIVVANASLGQARMFDQMPEAVAALTPGLVTPAQRAIQFTRSTPGIAVALVGMGQAAHVRDNLGVARVAPIASVQYQRFYQ